MTDKQEAYVIYDRANESYLTGGYHSHLLWNRTNNVMAARFYDDQSAAERIIKRLQNSIKRDGGWDEIVSHYHRKNPNIPRKTPDLYAAQVRDPIVEVHE